MRASSVHPVAVVVAAVIAVGNAVFVAVAVVEDAAAVVTRARLRPSTSPTRLLSRLWPERSASITGQPTGA